MSGATPPAEVQIARLQARVEALEAALERRSQQLRRIQEHVCARDLVLIGRLAAGLPPLPRFAVDPLLWVEILQPLAADVDEVLEDLWTSVTPRAAAAGGSDSLDEP